MVDGVTGGRSTYGICFGALAWLVEDGRVADIDVSGLAVVLVVRYDDDEPGSPWTIVLHVDASGNATAASVTTSGTGCLICTGTTSNTDLVGQLTLSTGTASYSFTASPGYVSAPRCVATDSTAANPVQVTTTTSTLTINGTGSDVITYICIGRT